MSMRPNKNVANPRLTLKDLDLFLLRKFESEEELREYVKLKFSTFPEEQVESRASKYGRASEYNLKTTTKELMYTIGKLKPRTERADPRILLHIVEESADDLLTLLGEYSKKPSYCRSRSRLLEIRLVIAKHLVDSFDGYEQKYVDVIAKRRVFSRLNSIFAMVEGALPELFAWVKKEMTELIVELPEDCNNVTQHAGSTFFGTAPAAPSVPANTAGESKTHAPNISLADAVSEVRANNEEESTAPGPGCTIM